MRREDFYPKQHQRYNRPTGGKIFTIRNIFYGVMTLVIISVVYIYFGIINTLPSLAQLENPPQEYATKILDSDGNLLENFFIKRRMYVPYDSIPKPFFQALIATEDREFYNHWGVHSMRIAKAVVKNIMALGAKEGASTITQQLARNLYFTQEQTLTRKIKEAITAVQIEKTYTKNEILEMYANTVNFGRGAYGIQVASHVMFGKPPYRLSPSECAYLVGVLKAPSKYDAKENYSKAIVRRNTVLALMEEVGFVTNPQRKRYSEEPIKLNDGSKIFQGSGIAPHFIEMIRKKLSKDERLSKYDIYKDGLTIYTTLNSQIQRYANESVETQLRSFQKEFDGAWSWSGKQQLLNAILERSAKESSQYLAAEDDESKSDIVKKLIRTPAFIDSVKRAVTTIQTAVCMVEPATGAILAMVGASPLSMERNPSARYSLNHCTETTRQPGSAFKPFVYASAMVESNLTPWSSVESGSFSYALGNGKTWSPHGSSRTGGAMSLESALQFSINTVAARLITQYTKPTRVVSLAKRMGITTPMDAFPALALGVEEVYPL
ncbi:MAG: transglycosylase domain-containing protein, partial [Candidatus Kapabacteria bacterium]|nr:transglycosylase domain-containing protein [Candidatus Kapabacteria bacterium]